MRGWMWGAPGQGGTSTWIVDPKDTAPVGAQKRTGASPVDSGIIRASPPASVLESDRPAVVTRSSGGRERRGGLAAEAPVGQGREGSSGCRALRFCPHTLWALSWPPVSASHVSRAGLTWRRGVRGPRHGIWGPEPETRVEVPGGTCLPSVLRLPQFPRMNYSLGPPCVTPETARPHPQTALPSPVLASCA